MVGEAPQTKKKILYYQSEHKRQESLETGFLGTNEEQSFYMAFM